MKNKIKTERHTWGALYQMDNVKVRWHYQDVPSRCLFCGKDIDFYLLAEDCIPVCEDCLKKSLKIIKQYKEDSKTDNNPKIHYIDTYNNGEYYYDIQNTR